MGEMTLLLTWCFLSTFLIETIEAAPKSIGIMFLKDRYDDACNNVCKDLPVNDVESVCMMFSRYKRGYLFFVNQCHARRTVCKENLLLHMVHPSRCMKSNQFFVPVN